MYKLGIERISQKSPYLLEFIPERNALTFRTDYDVDYLVSFEKEDEFKVVEAYHFNLINLSHRKSPRDRKVEATVNAILENFFEENAYCIIYICETADGKQGSRARLFEAWYRHYGMMENPYMLLADSIEDEEGVINHIGIIFKKDNPRYSDIIREFADTVEFFRNKPE